MPGCVDNLSDMIPGYIFREKMFNGPSALNQIQDITHDKGNKILNYKYLTFPSMMIPGYNPIFRI